MINLVTIKDKVKIPITNKSIVTYFYSFNNKYDNLEHIIIKFPQEKSQYKKPLVRIHSECLTGDVFGSCRCDCGKQLEETINLLAKHGGYIIYLRQEGRGIGLYNKLSAYLLQDKGIDTFSANEKLGHSADSRDFTVASLMLKSIGVTAVHLISNNLNKKKSLLNNAIDVISVISTSCFYNKFNIKYLDAKKQQGHVFGKDVKD